LFSLNIFVNFSHKIDETYEYICSIFPRKNDKNFF